MTAGSSRVEVLSSPQEWQTLRPAWNEILALHSSGIEDMDVTASFDWTMALWETHWNSAEMEVLVLREGTEIAGLLPLHRFRKTIRRIPCRTIAPLTEIYSGRTGFLLRSLNLADVKALFAHLREGRSWDVLSVTLVQGSLHEKIFQELAAEAGLRTRVFAESHSPYIPLQTSWEQHFTSLPKKLRSTIRNGEKRLRERGDVTYRECRSVEEAKLFNAAVLEIERDSWKGAAGTSIAANPVHEAFHTQLTLKAAESGFFSGHILFMDDQPIAYVMGLLYNGVFLDLKESYRNAFREMSPGHVLKNFLFTRLYEQKTELYDFMGACEEYKMKWTDKTYSRVTYLLFNNTLKAQAARWLSSYATARASGKKERTPEVEGSVAGKPPAQQAKAPGNSKEEDQVNGAVRV